MPTYYRTFKRSATNFEEFAKHLGFTVQKKYFCTKKKEKP